MTGALAGTRAINKHDRVQSIQRETDLRVQGLRIFLIASVLAGAKNEYNRVQSMEFNRSLRETDL